MVLGLTKKEALSAGESHTSWATVSRMKSKGSSSPCHSEPDDTIYQNGQQNIEIGAQLEAGNEIVEFERLPNSVITSLKPPPTNLQSLHVQMNPMISAFAG